MLDEPGKFQYCFFPMRSLLEKPLTLLLILMLSPLQSVMSASLEQAVQSQGECMHDGDMEMAADAMKDDCEHCSSGDACSSGQCTPLTVLAMLPAFSYPIVSTLTTSSSLADVSFASLLHNSLFRPPRA